LNNKLSFNLLNTTQKVQFLQFFDHCLSEFYKKNSMKYLKVAFFILLTNGMWFSIVAQTTQTIQIQKYDITCGSFIYNSDQNYFHSSSLGACVATMNMGEVSFLSSGFWASAEFRPEEPIGIGSFKAEEGFEVSLFPNPVINDASIRFKCSERLELSLHIFHINGTKQKVLLLSVFESGDHEILLSRDQLGLAPGMYLMEIIARDPGKSNVKYRYLLKAMVTK
jgi:hypothetical protein